MRRSLEQTVGPNGLDKSEAARPFASLLRGYTRLLPLIPTERAAIRYLVPVRHIWIRGTGVTWALRRGWHPSEFDDGWFADFLR